MTLIPKSKLARCALGLIAVLLGSVQAAWTGGDGDFDGDDPALAEPEKVATPALESPPPAPLAEPILKEGSGNTAQWIEPADPDEFTLIAGGDVCFGREVGQRLLQDPAYDPFAAVAPLFSRADMRFVNLESQLSDQGGETQSKLHPLVFTGPPAGADALARAGIQIVSTANNHMWDYGERAFFETLANLRRAGVAYAGAGHHHGQTYSPVILTIKGFRIAVLAVTDIWNQGSLARHPARPYVAGADENALAVTARRLRARGEADVILVSYHGGVEYMAQPLPGTRALARRVVDYGADLFLGHHPHVIQGIELRHGKAIFYSLGNFLMNVNEEYPETGIGMVARVRFRRGEAPIHEICPVKSGGLSAAPLAGDSAREAFRESIRRVSARFPHAPEIGAFGDDGCAPLLPSDRRARAVASRTRQKRHAR
ncbi:MAG: CapA family protein [Polyangiaceae bacterium]|nr:CapA family protein [Polyangiaceae bacterium]NUQ74970.1 CapA family protein [Polyangiaceae bacterium]